MQKKKNPVKLSILLEHEFVVFLKGFSSFRVFLILNNFLFFFIIMFLLLLLLFVFFFWFFLQSRESQISDRGLVRRRFSYGPRRGRTKNKWERH